MWMLLVYVPWLGISTTTRHIVSKPIRMLAAVPRQHLVANLAIAINVYSGNLLELVYKLLHFQQGFGLAWPCSVLCFD
jgi:hypothetical protein